MLTTLHLYHRATVHKMLIEAIQRAWRRHQVLVPLYRHLAARAPDERRESLLLQLAERERLHQQRYERMLSRLRAPLPGGACLFDHIWLWLLPHCGPDLAMRWAAWVERRDTRAILEAMLLARSLIRRH